MTNVVEKSFPLINYSLKGKGKSVAQVELSRKNASSIFEKISSQKEQSDSKSVLSVLEQVAAVDALKAQHKSIRNCVLNKHSLMLWKKENPDKLIITNFRCKSWRCPNCAKMVQNRDFTRISDAIHVNPGKWIFTVLTFNQAMWKNKEEAFISIKQNSNKLIKRMRRSFGDFIYVQTVEQHRRGFPHVNMLFRLSSDFEINDDECERLRARWFVPNAVSCGFGKMLSMEIAHGDGSAVANYVAKTGTTTIGEVTKISQAPIAAPKGFRRLRSSYKLLKPINKANDWTGVIIKSELKNIQKLSQELVINSAGNINPEILNVKSVEYNFYNAGNPIINDVIINNEVDKFNELKINYA